MEDPKYTGHKEKSGNAVLNQRGQGEVSLIRKHPIHIVPRN